MSYLGRIAAVRRRSGYVDVAGSLGVAGRLNGCLGVRDGAGSLEGVKLVRRDRGTRGAFEQAVPGHIDLADDRQTSGSRPDGR